MWKGNLNADFFWEFFDKIYIRRKLVCFMATHNVPLKGKKKGSERMELLWRVLVLIVSGIILGIWKALVFVLALVNWIMILFTNERNKDLAVFCEYWNSEVYRYFKYLTCVTNERPFPFTSMKRIGKFEK